MVTVSNRNHEKCFETLEKAFSTDTNNINNDATDTGNQVLNQIVALFSAVGKILSDLLT